jgi:SAM-dependent methyltransferase
MIDVIEHTAAPLEALSLAAARLKDGGILVITTANSWVLPWRLMPREYWYYFAEHICFFSPRWFRWAATRLDLGVEEVTLFSHYPPKRRATPLVELAAAYTSRLLGDPQGLPMRLARRAHAVRGRPGTYHWRDHMLVVLRKR